jgi:hypothetical protein
MLEKVDLDEITKGAWGLSEVYGHFLLEGCMITLHRNNHYRQAVMEITGNSKMTVELSWPVEKLSKKAERTWADQDTATEQAAECIAFAIVPRITGLHLLRTYRGPGFDFHLGDLYQNQFIIRARLEVSGIFKGSPEDIKRRYRSKSRQTDKSDASRLTAYILVTEFSTPTSNFLTKL